MAVNIARFTSECTEEKGLGRSFVCAIGENTTASTTLRVQNIKVSNFFMEKIATEHWPKKLLYLFYAKMTHFRLANPIFIILI